MIQEILNCITVVTGFFISFYLVLMMGYCLHHCKFYYKEGIRKYIAKIFDYMNKLGNCSAWIQYKVKVNMRIIGNKIRIVFRRKPKFDLGDESLATFISIIITIVLVSVVYMVFMALFFIDIFKELRVMVFQDMNSNITVCAMVVKCIKTCFYNIFLFYLGKPGFFITVPWAMVSMAFIRSIYSGLYISGQISDDKVYDIGSVNSKNLLKVSVVIGILYFSGKIFKTLAIVSNILVGVCIFNFLVSSFLSIMVVISIFMLIEKR